MKQANILIPVTFVIAIVCILWPWFTIQSQYIVNGNISWLLIAAERLLNGAELVSHVYETNPPLNILIYIPHVLFSKLANLPLTIGSLYVTSFFVVVSAFVTYSIINKFEHFSQAEKYTLVLAHIIATTLAASVFFSDREHFIILTLIPFILCQFAITEQIKLPKKITLPVFIVGAICILIKPHYGLIPTVLLIHRMFKQRSLKVIFHADFMALAISTLSYITITYFVFNDFVTTILPDVLTLYVNKGQDTAQVIKIATMHVLLYTGLFIFDLISEDLDKNKKRLVIWLEIISLLCLVPYFVQMKGYYNHLIPAYAFFILALSLSICFRLSGKNTKIAIFSIIVPVIIAACTLELFSPLNTEVPKQKDVPNMAVTQYLEKECTKPCSFFAFHGDIEIFNPTAARMGYTHATRFPSFWFLPEILKSPKKHKELNEKYINFIVEDLEYYKPSIILLSKDLPIGPLKFNFLDYFGEDERMKKLFELNYTKQEDFEFDRAEYFKGTSLGKSHILKFDVYKLNP